MSYITGTYNGVASTEILWIFPDQRSGLTNIVYQSADSSLMMDTVEFSDASAMTIVKTVRLATSITITA